MKTIEKHRTTNPIKNEIRTKKNISHSTNEKQNEETASLNKERKKQKYQRHR